MNWRHALTVALALALLAPLACKKRADVTAGESAAVLKGAPTEHAAVEKLFAPLPAGVLGVAGAKSVAALRTMIDATARGLGETVGGDVLGGLDLPPAIVALVDEKRPLYAVLFPKDDGVYAALAIPLSTKGRAAVDAAKRRAPGVEAPTPELAALSLEADNARLAGDYLLWCHDTAALAQHTPLLKKAIAEFQPATTAQLIVSGPAALELVRPVVEETKRDLVELMRWSAEVSPTPMGSKEVGEFYEAYFDATLDLLGEVASIDVRLTADGERGRLEVLVEVEEGGTLRQIIAHGEKGGIASAGLLPPGAWAVMATNLEPGVFGAWRTQYVKILSALMRSVPSYEIEGAFNAMYDAITGDTATAIYADGGFPFSLAGVVLTTDGDSYREGIEKLSSLYLNWAESMMAQAGAVGPSLDFSSWKRLMEGASAFTAAMGVELKVRDSGDVVGMSVGVNWDSIGAFGDPNGAQKNAKLFGSEWQLGLGFGPKVSSTCLGPNGYAHAEKILAGGFRYEDTAFAASVKRGAAHPFLVLWLDAGRAANAFADMFEATMMAVDGARASALGAQLKQAKAGDAVALTVGGSGTTLQLVLDLPFAPIAQFSTLADMP